MALPPLVAGARALRRALARHQGHAPQRAARVPLWRLLAGELLLLLRWPFEHHRARVWLPAAAVAVATVVGLSDATPGPVLALPGRLTLAIVLAAVGIVLATWHRGRPDS